MNNYVGYKRLYINPIGTSHYYLYLVYGKETTLIGKWYIPSIILSNVGASRAGKIRNKASWKNMRNISMRNHINMRNNLACVYIFKNWKLLSQLRENVKFLINKFYI